MGSISSQLVQRYSTSPVVEGTALIGLPQSGQARCLRYVNGIVSSARQQCHTSSKMVKRTNLAFRTSHPDASRSNLK